MLASACWYGDILLLIVCSCYHNSIPGHRSNYEETQDERLARLLDNPELARAHPRALYFQK